MSGRVEIDRRTISHPCLELGVPCRPFFSPNNLMQVSFFLRQMTKKNNTYCYVD